MKTEQLVRAEATVVTILNLKKGDIYLRIDNKESSTGEEALKYGVVSDILHNGEDSVIIAIERYKAKWSDAINVERKVFQTNESLKLFHADKESFQLFVKSLEETQQRNVDAADRALAKALDLRKEIQKLRTLTLSEPETSVSTLEAHKALVIEATASDPATASD